MIDIFCRYGFGVPIKKKTPQSITHKSPDIIFKSNLKPCSIETDGGKGFVNKTLIIFLNTEDTKKYRSYTRGETVFAGRCNRRILDLLIKPVYEKKEVQIGWQNHQKYSKTFLIPSIFLAKTTPIQASMKMKSTLT